MNINYPVSCDVMSMIYFLNTESHNTAKVHCELGEIDGPTIISEEK